VATSVRMENFYWGVLEEIAGRGGMTCNQVITKLWFESMDADHDLGNFTSFLRVCCGRYLALIAQGEISNNLQDPLGNVDSAGILAREGMRRAKAQGACLQTVATR